MPRNQIQRMVFAFLTVLVTVHGYVFYSLYVVNGNTLMQVTGADSVLHAIDTQGGVYGQSVGGDRCDHLQPLLPGSA